jgi:hypothetical protein
VIAEAEETDASLTLFALTLPQESLWPLPTTAPKGSINLMM